MPESFNVLVKEIRSLAIDIDLDRRSILRAGVAGGKTERSS